MVAAILQNTGQARAEALLQYALSQVASTPKPFPLWTNLLPPTDTFPGYEVIGELRRGGQGTVYKARRNATGRVVALKLFQLHGQQAHALRARAEREIEVLAKLNNRNIVSIHDAGVANQGLFLVMDYVDGRTPDQYLGADDPDFEEIARLFVKICDAVNAAHLKGVIHRDLKPSNILIDDAGEPYILDFGLAKVTDADSVAPALTETGQFLGTLCWSAPEQASGSNFEIDIRTDVYALGLLLFYATTGRFPYDVGTSLRETVENIVNTRPVPPRDIVSNIPPDFETIILKCLEKEPARRYQSAGALAADLRAYLRGDAISARRHTTAYLLLRMARRHRLAVTAIALISILLVGYAATVTIAYRRVQEHAADARAKFGLAQDTLTAVVNEVGRQLEGVSGGVKARQAVMEIAEGPLTLLAQERSDDPELQRLRARALFSLGDTRLRLGDGEQAVRYLQECLQLRLSLAASSPDDAELLAQISDTYRYLAGESYARRDYETQKHFYEQSMAVDEALAQRHPREPSCQERLLEAYCNMANVHTQLYEFDQSILFRDKQRSVLDRVLELNTSPFTRINLLWSLHYFQREDFDAMGRCDEARANSLAALAYAKQAAAAAPDDAYWAHRVAGENLVLYGYARNSGDYELAWKHGQASLDWNRKVLALSPDEIDYRTFEGVLNLSLAWLAELEGDREKEEQYLGQAEAVFNALSSIPGGTPHLVPYGCGIQVSRAANAYEDRDLETAEQLMKEALETRRGQIKEHPEDVGLLTSYAELLREAVPHGLRNYPLAVTMAEGAVEHSYRRSPSALHHLAMALDLDGRHELAQATFDEALQLLGPDEVCGRTVLESRWSRRGKLLLAPTYGPVEGPIQAEAQRNRSPMPHSDR